MPKFNLKINQGFTLIEMAIVLIILGLVLSALLMPIRAQRDLQAQRQTEETLARAKQALMGFAQTFGRLPCPATAVNFQGNTDNGSLGQESPLGGTQHAPASAVNCSAQSGYLSATTLGLQPVDNQGFALDAWNNRIRYAITNVSSTTAGGAGADFTTSGEISNIGISNLQPNLRICADSSVARCSTTANLANNAVAVIFSTGVSGVPLVIGSDENENLNATGAGTLDQIFVSHDITAAGAPNGEFDHMVVWVSPFELYSAMIAAGQLR